jgi:hypothetical protein
MGSSCGSRSPGCGTDRSEGRRRGVLVRDAISVAFAATVFAWGCSHGRPPAAGFWYENESFVLPAHEATRLDRQLTPGELEWIRQLSRHEIERAFSGLRITIGAERSAFWRVAVVRSLAARTLRRQAPRAGESLALGILGGTGAVGFDVVASQAVRYAPQGASRQLMLEAIGRGIGRVAVHEFMHQILGPTAIHAGDIDSYEHGSPDRASQYYGELHWTGAWPLLQRRLGSR